MFFPVACSDCCLFLSVLDCQLRSQRFKSLPQLIDNFCSKCVPSELGYKISMTKVHCWWDISEVRERTRHDMLKLGEVKATNSSYPWPSLWVSLTDCSSSCLLIIMANNSCSETLFLVKSMSIVTAFCMLILKSKLRWTRSWPGSGRTVDSVG